MYASDAKTRIIERARQIGFDLVGIAGAQPFTSAMQVFQQRVDAGHLGQWRYSGQDIARNCTPAQTLPHARSIICTATCYLSAARPYDPYAPGLRGAVSCHAWGKDYHRVIGTRLEELAAFIRDQFEGAHCVACVDTGPLVDRAAAVRAGIGWFGKNGNVLTKRFGSYVLLGELITDLELAPDQPLRTNCGSCSQCMADCPTGAILAQGTIDARRCISDMTQLKRPIPREFRKAIGNRIWGCDDCQTGCPVNERRSRDGERSLHPEFEPLPAIGTAVDLPAVLHMTKAQFRQWFGPTSMAWRGKAVLQRNAAVALGNSRDMRAVPHLETALQDRKPLVRGHAAWALGELGGEQAKAALASLLQSETDGWVREEGTLALAKLESARRTSARKVETCA